MYINVEEYSNIEATRKIRLKFYGHIMGLPDYTRNNCKICKFVYNRWRMDSKS